MTATANHHHPDLDQACEDIESFAVIVWELHDTFTPEGIRQGIADLLDDLLTAVEHEEEAE